MDEFPRSSAAATWTNGAFGARAAELGGTACYDKAKKYAAPSFFLDTAKSGRDRLISEVSLTASYDLGAPPVEEPKTT